MVALISGLSLILCFASQSRRIAYVAKCVPERRAPGNRKRVKAGAANVEHSSLTLWRRREGPHVWVVESLAWQFGYADNYRAKEGGSEGMVMDIWVKRAVPGITWLCWRTGRAGREPRISLEECFRRSSTCPVRIAFF